MGNHGPMHWCGDRSCANSGAGVLGEDLAPLKAAVPAADGVFNMSDLLMIQNKVMGLVSF